MFERLLRKRGFARFAAAAIWLAGMASPGLAEGFAFGIERLSGQFVRLELADPETLTRLGPSGASTAVNACEFDGGGSYERIFCIDTANPANFFSLDTRTGAREDLGTIDVGPSTFVVALATDPTTGVVHAIVCTGLFVASLHTFDPATGTLTFVAPISGSDCLVAAGFDSAGAMFGLAAAEDELVSIDEATGEVTSIGPIGFDATFPPTIDFDGDDGCFLFSDNVATGAGELRSCDTATGGTTFVGNFGSDSPGGLGSISAAAIHPGGLFADGFELEDSSRWSLTSPVQ